MARLAYAGLTDVGMKRGHNEDNLLLMPEHGIFVVCDGMGGHASGEVASAIAVETIEQFIRDSEEDEDLTWPYKEEEGLSPIENRLKVAVRYANKRVFEKAAEHPKYKGMGTTLVASAFDSSNHYYAHVGDSRCYRIRNGTIEQLTEDHSLLNDYKKMANLTPEEEEAFPHKNIIVRALGMKDSVEVDLGRNPIEPGDIYLLCSDGLSGEVSDEHMLAIVEEHRGDLEVACKKLIDAANAHGGKDNITVILVEVLPD